MSEFAVIWNPSKVERDELAEALQTAGAADITWFETTKDDPGQGSARAALAESPRVIAVAGGDGTVRAVAEVLAELEDAPELAILPQGTGNLLARNLDIPLSLPEAAERAVNGAGAPIDFGWVEVTSPAGTERHGFAVIVGFGVDANMIAETDDDLKAKAGWLAYLESMGRAVSATDVLDLTVTVDGESRSEQGHTVLVGNCGTIQGGLAVLPDAEPDDGKLDMLVLREDGLDGWFATVKTMVWDNGIKRIFSGDDDSAESTTETQHVQLTSVRIELPEAREFQVDGEQIGEVTAFEASISPGAITIRS